MHLCARADSGARGGRTAFWSPGWLQTHRLPKGYDPSPALQIDGFLLQRLFLGVSTRATPYMWKPHGCQELLWSSGARTTHVNQKKKKRTKQTRKQNQPGNITPKQFLFLCLFPSSLCPGFVPMVAITHALHWPIVTTRAKTTLPCLDRIPQECSEKTCGWLSRLAG